MISIHLAPNILIIIIDNTLYAVLYIPVSNILEIQGYALLVILVIQ